MSWKQTAQYSFADALLVEYKSLFKLDDVHELSIGNRSKKRSAIFMPASAVCWHLYTLGIPAFDDV